MAWLSIKTCVGLDDADDMSALLQALGAIAVTVENASNKPHFEISMQEQAKWSSQTITGLFEEQTNPQNILLSIAQNMPQASLNSVEQIADQDWKRSWLENFKPVKAGDKLWIVPSWMQAPDPDAINIVIDPGLAFGTGTHPTTHLCLNALSKAELRGKSVVDYGCGSGILGITALKLGAKEAVGTDIDARAHATSLENAKINGVTKNFSVASALELHGQKFDLVLANILLPTLIELAEGLINLVKESGEIWLSGIMPSQINAITQNFSEFSFTTTTQDDWILTIGKKALTGERGFRND